MFLFRSLTLFLFLLILRPLDLYAQYVTPDQFPETVQFGVIGDSLFNTQPGHDYPFEYLLKDVDISFSNAGENIVAMIDYLVRIRVYSDDPIEQAEAALTGIPFYFYDDIERIVSIEGITHQPGGEKVELDPGQITTVDLNSRYKIREFMMPDIRAGSIIEYRYRIVRRYIEELPDIYFSHRVPTRKVTVSLHNVDYMRYEVLPENVEFDLGFIEERIDTSSIPHVFTFWRPEPVLKQHWVAYNIPAVHDYSYVSTIDDLRGKLKFQLNEFGQPRQILDNSWEYVSALIRRGANNPFEISDQLTGIRETGRSVADSVGSSEDILNAVFEYVNGRIVYNGTRRAFPDRNLDRVLEGEPSDQAAINMVLFTMLRGAGVDAYPVYLSGREAGRINRQFPSVYQFNQILVYADTDSGGVFMDASFPHSRPGLIPVDSYNEMGMLFRPDRYSWIDILPEHSIFDLDLNIAGRLLDDGTLTGKIDVITGGYPAQQIKAELAMGRPVSEIIADNFFDTYSEVQFQQVGIRENEDGEYPLRIEAEFEIPQYAVSFTEGLQYRPMVVGYLQRNPFEEINRNAPITLDAPEKLRIEYTITPPENFQIDRLLQSRETNTSGAVLREEYEISNEVMNYFFEVDIVRKEFSADEYSQLKNLYDRWVFLSNDEWFIGE